MILPRTGRVGEGVFYGMWTFASKIGQAFGIALTGWVLTAFAYQQPTDAIAEPVQAASAIAGIRILAGPIPAIFFVAGVIVLSFYPITREVYDQIMVRVREREETNGAPPTK